MNHVKLFKGPPPRCPFGAGTTVVQNIAIRLVQWLGWLFETQERKKEREKTRLGQITCCTKIEGRLREKIGQKGTKSKNSCRLSNGVVGAYGKVTKNANWCGPETKYKRSKIGILDKIVSMAKLGRQGWELLEWTETKRRDWDDINGPRINVLYPLLESMIYVAWRPRIVAPAHSTI